MEDLGELFLIKVIHDLPKPLNHLMRRIVRRFILSIVKPILKIDEGDSVEKHFHFMGLKDRNPVDWEDFFDTSFDVGEGSRYFYLSVHFDAKVDIKAFISIGDFFVFVAL